jgi:starch phosphorylase
MKKPASEKTVAYFCAEFGIDSNTPTYAGGLGILAGDTLKEAADRDYPMIGIGLLYQGKYFIQRINNEGWQTEDVSLYDPASACLRQVTVGGKPLYIVCRFDKEDVYIKSYQVRVGDHTHLYLLTSDSHKNSDDWRSIMAADYTGGDEVQLRQQLVLGIGGVKLLQALKIKPDIYHFNEGRPCFVTWEWVLEIMKKSGKNFDEAVEEAKSRTVYTNHTLLRSGNLHYNADLVRKYAWVFATEMGVGTQELITPGLTDNNQFSITDYAMKNSSKQSAVSKRHGKLSESEWPEYKWISITNGIHLPSWQNTNFRDPNLSDSQIWAIHQMRKGELEKLVERRSGFGYDPNRLVVSWARRMAGYKQLHVLFDDIARLEAILRNTERPIQLLVAGKAHPGDEAAKRSIQITINHMSRELAECAIFVPNYDIALARSLVSGSDIWLNTPEYGKEACGTSGMKALSNGVLNCTVADGWADEVNWEEYGWTLDPVNLSKSFYEVLEKNIAPEFYQRNLEGMPESWLAKMKASMKLAQNYSTERMFDEYLKYLYA